MGKNFLNYFVFFGMLITLIMGIFANKLTHNKYPYLSFAKKISGEIIIVKNNRGSHYFTLKNNQLFSVRLYDGNFDTYDLLTDYKEFDTIYKHANSDTLYFRRNGKLCYALIYYKKDKGSAFKVN